jgi:hypothetical protein
MLKETQQRQKELEEAADVLIPSEWLGEYQASTW